MENYSDISVKYLLYQKKRTILTVFGITITVGVLFAILTLFFNYFIAQRDACREEGNYEVVLFTRDEAVISGVVSKDYVKDVYKGQYYDIYTESYINDAIFINFENPYKINSYFDQITGEYGIKGQINNDLAAYYLQGDEGSQTYIICLLFLLLSYIFAIIGVGIIRNTIQLNTIEQIKDYGILRCIGSTMDELSKIIFKMGFIQEIIGIIIGIIVGYVGSVVIGLIYHMKVTFLLIPVVYVLVVFLFDLYFVMRENSKIVKKISPVEALNANMGINNRKIKVKKKSLFGILFGFEGDYAYRNITNDKKRFRKTIAGLTFGLVAVVIFGSLCETMVGTGNRLWKDCGEYQVYYFEYLDGMSSVDELKANLPTQEKLNLLMQNKNFIESRAMYAMRLPLAFPEEVSLHICDEYLRETENGSMIQNAIDSKKLPYLFFKANIVGYTEEEYKEYEDLLLEGTLDVGENGIVISNNSWAIEMISDDELSAMDDLTRSLVPATDYKLGDEIRLIDYEKLFEMYSKELTNTELKTGVELFNECCEKLAEQGFYRTYVIEGIVECEKDMLGSIDLINVIVPLEKYYDISGLSEGMASTGVKLKYDKNIVNDSAFIDSLFLSDGDGAGETCRQNHGIYGVYEWTLMKNITFCITFFMIFMLIMNSLNIINLSEANIYQRRLELAQLRVIGVSKKRICRIIVLEGVITSIIGCVVGTLLGVGAIALIKKAILVMFLVRLNISWRVVFLVVLYMILINCGSPYFSIRRKKDTLLEDLK